MSFLIPTAASIHFFQTILNGFIIHIFGMIVLSVFIILLIVASNGICALNSTTVSHPFYDSDDKDSGFPHATAQEIRIKMKSRQVYTLFSSDVNAKLEETDSESICAIINKKSWEWALLKASDAARERFGKYGQRYLYISAHL